MPMKALKKILRDQLELKLPEPNRTCRIHIIVFGNVLRNVPCGQFVNLSGLGLRSTTLGGHDQNGLRQYVFA